MGYKWRWKEKRNIAKMKLKKKTKVCLWQVDKSKLKQQKKNDRHKIEN